MSDIGYIKTKPSADDFKEMQALEASFIRKLRKLGFSGDVKIYTVEPEGIMPVISVADAYARWERENDK